VARIAATLAFLTILVTVATVWAAGLMVNGGTLQGFALAVRAGPTSASVDIHPESLQKRSEGQPVTAYIEMSDGFDVESIDVSTAQICREGAGCVPASLAPTSVGDYDNDGIRDRMVKFDRAAVIDLLEDVEPPSTVTLTVSGIVDPPGRAFAGSDTVGLVGPDAEPTMAIEDSTPAATSTESPTTTATPAATSTEEPTATGTARPSWMIGPEPTSADASRPPWMIGPEPTSADASRPPWMIGPELEPTSADASRPPWMIGPEPEPTSAGTPTPTWMIGPGPGPGAQSSAAGPTPVPTGALEATATPTPGTGPIAPSGSEG
jgi:hypothetical protein